jgi:AraC-like DNA-binding protein
VSIIVDNTELMDTSPYESEDSHLMSRIVTFLPQMFPDPDNFAILTLGTTDPDRSYHVERRNANFFSLAFATSGKSRISYEGDEWIMRPGDVSLFPISSSYACESFQDDPIEKIWIRFGGSISSSLYREYHLDQQIVYTDVDIQALLDSFLSLCNHSRNNMRTLSTRGALLIHEIFAMLSPLNQTGKHLRDDVIDSAKNYIDLNSKRPLLISEVASAVGMSVSQLDKLFTSRYGKTPYQYYQDNRIQMACSLLTETSLRIGEISDHLRFPDAHYFSSRFKQRTGLTPRDYRKQKA